MGKEKEEMSFLSHLEVFRWHLIRSAGAILFFTIIAFMFKEIIFDVILLGPQKKDFPTYKALCSISNFLGLDDVMCNYKSSFTLQNISMSGQFSAHITTSIFAGFIVAFPYVFWELWRFISPALYDAETKIARWVVFFSSILFLFGVLFGYYVIAPLSVNFLGSYQVSSAVDNQISLTSFISTITTVSLANGIIFELPILVYFLTKVGLLTPKFMRIYRKHAMVLTLILSAIITPPDIISQILVAVPLMILYEISITISSSVLNKESFFKSFFRRMLKIPKILVKQTGRMIKQTGKMIKSIIFWFLWVLIISICCLLLMGLFDYYVMNHPNDEYGIINIFLNHHWPKFIILGIIAFLSRILCKLIVNKIFNKKQE